jgi:hypothetical protein
MSPQTNRHSRKERNSSGHYQKRNLFLVQITEISQIRITFGITKNIVGLDVAVHESVMGKGVQSKRQSVCNTPRGRLRQPRENRFEFSGTEPLSPDVPCIQMDLGGKNSQPAASLRVAHFLRKLNFSFHLFRTSESSLSSQFSETIRSFNTKLRKGG